MTRRISVVEGSVCHLDRKLATAGIASRAFEWLAALLEGRLFCRFWKISETPGNALLTMVLTEAAWQFANTLTRGWI